MVKLRALWTLYVIGAADDNFLRIHLHHSNEHIRTSAIRLLTDTWPLDTVMSQRPIFSLSSSGGEGRGEEAVHSLLPELIRLAKTDRSGLVRLALTSTLQRLPISQRAQLAAPLIARKA